MVPQDSQNCGRNLRKRELSDAEFARNSLLRMVIIDIVINTVLGRVTRHPAGMHCPWWDDAFVSSKGLCFIMYLSGTFWTERHRFLLVGKRTVLLSVTQRFYVLGTPYCIYRSHKICCKPLLRQERKILLTSNGPLCMRNDWPLWPERTLPSTRCIIVLNVVAVGQIWHGKPFRKKGFSPG